MEEWTEGKIYKIKAICKLRAWKGKTYCLSNAGEELSKLHAFVLILTLFVYIVYLCTKLNKYA